MENTKNYPGCPFRTELDLSGLIKYWKDNLKNDDSSIHYASQEILDQIEKAQELHAPINDLSVIKKNKDLIGLLMSVVFPPALSDTMLMGAHVPFNFSGFLATPGYAEILPFDNPREDIRLYSDTGDAAKGTIMMAYLFILNTYFGTNIEFNVPIILGVPDKRTGLERIYKLEVDTRFVEVVALEKPESIDSKTIAMLLENLYDVDLWQKYIRPQNFVFRGFALHKLVDVTDQEMLSSIKYYLLRRDAVTCGVNFLTIQEKIQTLFALPDLKLGIVFFDPHNNIISSAGISDWNSFMLHDKHESLSCSYFSDSIYDKAYVEKKPVIIEDLSKYDRKTKIEKTLLEQDIRNIIIAPLMNNNEVIGMLELVTPNPGNLNFINAGKLKNVLPMFSAAITRVLGDLQNEVRAAIQKECTAIHPSVEWKFLQAGYEMVSQRQQGKKSTLPEIVFENVYPLFGMSDIRNSSVLRNQAIREDLLENLSMAKKIVEEILEYRNMPILNELIFRINNEMALIEPGLASGSESGVISFLKEEVNPAIRLFQDHNEEIKALTDTYFKSLDPDLGVIYHKRRDFETSLTQVNQNISKLIDQAEVLAQDIVPHYFEKYKTDGVEYNLYLGQSLLENGTFDTLYLRNFRLWQLITMCDIARNIDDLQEELSHPLEIAQLILVHSEPLAIRFRQDEKRFDVDGAYNIRYEIVKKRIDKAHIKGTGERLTQPGKISIVYSRESDAAEYLRYIEYLKTQDFLLDEVEQFEIEELQGAKGLQALRVSINQQRKVEDNYGDDLINDLMNQLEKA